MSRTLIAVAAIALGCAIPVLAEPLPGIPRGPLPIEPDRPPLPLPSPLLPRPLPPELCTGSTLLTLPSARVTDARMYVATDVTLPSTDVVRVPAHCRITGVAQPPGTTSEIGFQVWIPFDGTYRGRYLQLGNGGFSGSIDVHALTDGVSRGYATSATDDGHTGLWWDGSFATRGADKIIDFGHRSLKQTADNAKAIVRAVTGRTPDRSYFKGCSNGGRQALMVAQRYPAEFDGIVAGAPANYFTHQFASFAWNAQQIYEPLPVVRPATLLPAGRLVALSQIVREQCAGRDGGLRADPFLTNPLICRPNFDRHICTGAPTDSCLTSREAAIAQKIYAGPVHTRTGLQIFPGLEPGAEAHPFNWEPWLIGPSLGIYGAQSLIGSQFFGHFLGDARLFDLRNVDVSSRVDEADLRFGAHLNAIDPNLGAFYDRGGKLLQFHGFDDAAVAAKNSIDYWTAVWTEMRARRSGFTRRRFDDFYRLFMVAGLGHCAGGAGANEFGNGVRGLSLAPEHDLMAAIEQWVERGVTPTRFTARHRLRGLVRPLCPYPQSTVHHLNAAGLPEWSCSLRFSLHKDPERMKPWFYPGGRIPPRPPTRSLRTY